jgi:EAL domain-containing protein (putative c-di-GMP-specific phosphodiesterase class I)
MEAWRFEPNAAEVAPDVGRQPVPRAARRSRAAGAEAPVRSLLASARLETLFQPIFLLAGVEAGACVGVEALTRGPEGSELAGADALFAAVRRARLEIDADRLCLSLALANARSLPRLDLMVNVHLETLLRDDAFLRHVLHSAAMTGVATSRLVLEIVEHHAATDLAGLGQAIKRLRDAGVRIALDDLGAGHLQLGLIRHVSPDLIKLDRRLLASPRPLDETQRLLASFAATARRIGAQAVVEGVETAEQVELVAAAGIPLVQGYFFGRPRAATDLALAVRQDAPSAILPQPHAEVPDDWLALDRLGIAAVLVDDRHRLVAATRAARDLGAPLPTVGAIFEPLDSHPGADSWGLQAPGAVVQVTPLGRWLKGGLRLLGLAIAAPPATRLGSALPRPAWLELDLGGTILSTSEPAAALFALAGVADLVGSRLDQVWSCPEPLSAMLTTAAVAGVWQADALHSARAAQPGCPWPSSRSTVPVSSCAAMPRPASTSAPAPGPPR